MSKIKPVLLLILDGWGHSQLAPGNAIVAAKTPTWDALMKNAPHTLISGCGEDVGLPEGQMGNSEVGHLTMGAGRVIFQDLTRISKSISEGTFFENPTLKEAFAQAAQTHKAVHMMGLLSPGGVHSHENHLFACIQMAHNHGASPIYVHAFLDGRDTPPRSAKASLEKLETAMAPYNAVLASISGRFYAMDRDNRWDRIQLAYQAIAHGQAPYYAQSGLEALQCAYDRQETDEFVKPTCILDAHQQSISVKSGDIIIFMNFRSDRARELSYAFTQSDFKKFDRGNPPSLGNFISLTEYDKNLPAKIAFPAQVHRNVLGEFLQHCHLKQLHLAETEKYAHVTFFFNGGIETPYEGEQRILIPSPKVTTYDLQPQMSALELTEILVDNIRKEQFDFIVCNYANADMVGHTGNLEATIKAIEILDECMAIIISALASVNGEALITSDHGNAECMIDKDTQQAHTAHTTSLVPLVYVGKRKLKFPSDNGKLSDIAPTLLQLMDLAKPNEMTGHSLIQFLPT